MTDPRLPIVRLRPGREASARGRHPWIFSGSVAAIEGSPEEGAEVRVTGADGRFVCRGFWNARSQIVVRGYRWDDEPLDPSFLGGRIDRAISLRTTLSEAGRTPPPRLEEGSAVRLLFSEGDGFPGLTVDRYGTFLVVQITSLALALRKELLLDLLEERLAPDGIVLRTEKGVGEEEGAELRDGVVRGREPDGPIEILEEGTRFLVDLRTGQKTGFYLDQRDNRRVLAPFAEGRRVADVCCYSGGFSLPLARAGARAVTGVDVSNPALDLARENARRNGMEDRTTFERQDAAGWLRARAEAGDRFDLVVLDPPRFARSRQGIAAALKGYAALNTAAMGVIEPGGILLTCSCSGRVSTEEFLSMLGRVSAEAGRTLRILQVGGQAPDHPVSATCPEGRYLKAVLAEVG